MDPNTLEEDKPVWAKNRGKTFVDIYQQLVKRRIKVHSWRKEEVKSLNECRDLNMSWEQIAEKLKQQEFGTIRTPKQIQACRLKF